MKKKDLELDTCPVCQNSFNPYPVKGDRVRRKTCSRKCGSELTRSKLLGREITWGNKISEATKGVPRPVTEAKRKFYDSVIGTHRSKVIRDKISKAHLGVKQKDASHHIDLDKKNESPENKITLTSGQHQQIHRRAYDYLLETFGIEEVKKYVEWFKVKYLLDDK